MSKLQIFVLAHTVVNYAGIREFGYTEHETFTESADELAEVAGRSCYESWKRPNPKTATVEGYLANILDHKHLSVLEHASVTFGMRGISRALTHELVRHRHLSPSQRSQRYVDESVADYVAHPSMNKNERDMLEKVHENSLEVYDAIFRSMIERGLDRKTARGAARFVLPNATETAIVLTGNHRAWREVIGKRNDPHADQEIHDLARALLVRLKELAPATYQDMPLDV